MVGLTLIFLFLAISSSWAVEESEIKLFFYQNPNTTTSPTSNYFFSYTLNNSTCNISSDVELSKNISVYIHGWEDVTKSEEIDLLNTLITTRPNDTIIWVEYPHTDYLTAFSEVTELGGYIGNFFNCLNSTYNYALNKIKLIGHSYGTHVCGNIGRTCNGELYEIVGLDPAAPLFDVSTTRLASTDAETVQGIHTSNIEGTILPVGDNDFYPEGGIVQPGCGDGTIPEDVTCNHVKAITYYIETILYGNYTGTKCLDYATYLLGLCSNADQAYMGQNNLDQTASGNYYLRV